MNIRFKHFLMALAVLMAIFLLVFFSFGIPILGTKPVIQTLDPAMARPGDRIVIRGSGFGPFKHRSRVFIAGQPLSSASIGTWSDREIEIIVPDFDRSTLVSVRTLKGESPEQVLINAGDFPSILPDPLIPGYPYVSYISPQSGAPGTLVEINGQNFGTIRNRSGILVARTEDTRYELFETPDLQQFLEVPDESILFWNDHLIRFILPHGAVTGPVIVTTPRGYSNPFSMEIAVKGVTVKWGGMDSWVCAQEFGIDLVSAYPGNTLYLWLPVPPTTPEQGDVSVTGPAAQDTGLVLDRYRLVRLDDIVTGNEFRLRQEVRVTRRSVRYEIQPWLIPTVYASENTVARDNLEIPYGMDRDTFRRFASAGNGLTRSDSHPYGKARLIYNFLLTRFQPAPDSPITIVTDIPPEQAPLGSRAYALLFVALARGSGIAARPVAGVRIPESGGGAVPHTWVEIYLEGVGWFPADPWMADAANNPELYWGALDSRRIAFSHGWSETVPLQTGGLFARSDIYSLQKTYAEAEGNIGAVRVSWIVPSVSKP